MASPRDQQRRRDIVIAAAHSAGCPSALLAAVFGLTAARIGEIVRALRREFQAGNGGLRTLDGPTARAALSRRERARRPRGVL